MWGGVGGVEGPPKETPPPPPPPAPPRRTGLNEAAYACSNTFLPAASSPSYTAFMPWVEMVLEIGPVMHSTARANASSSVAPWRV